MNDGKDVAAFLYAERSNVSTDAFNVLRVNMSVYKCTDVGYCMGYEPINNPVAIGTVHLWEDFVLSLQWDEVNKQFISQLNKNSPVYVPFVSDYGPPTHPIRKAIGALHMFAPCGTEGQEALVDAYIDNVYVLK